MFRPTLLWFRSAIAAVPNGSITKALHSAGLRPEDLDYVSANGLSTIEHDRSEAAGR